MFSGTTLYKNSGNYVGAHQKIDRLARRQLKTLIPKAKFFPSTKDILHFEGNNGPDAIKRKSPARDEPWHYYNPVDPNDKSLLKHLADHQHNLARALKTGNQERAAFEAAWMAHAVVDGLTPAHHYPLKAKIEELWGRPKEERLTVRQKMIIRGHNYRDTLNKNWQYWGAKGVFSTHFLFEWGVSSSIVTVKTPPDLPTGAEVKQVLNDGFLNYFKTSAQGIYKLGMYENFYKNGWNRKLARQTKRQLLPVITKTVTLGWLAAIADSES